MLEVQRIQEDQYSAPYHYLPRWNGIKFSSFAYWSWGFRYLGGIEFLLSLLAPLEFESLIDIGCGDGRLLSEIGVRFPGKILEGVDYSEQAIALAKVLSRGATFSAGNILSSEPVRQYDIATSVEVIEHIPPADLERFVAAMAERIRPGGKLILTVPHRNRPVEKKHFQHFDLAKLRELLSPHFADLRFIPFDRVRNPGLSLRLADWLLGGRGRFFLVTNRRILGRAFRHYLEHGLACRDETECGRIAAIGTRPL
jgi:SAM-dependent methyltransferase